MIDELPDAPDAVTPDAFAGPDHPMRTLTRDVAFGGQWNRDRAERVASLFSGMAEGWSAANTDAAKTAPVRDALGRGGLDFGRRWLELGSGTGAGTAIMAPRVARLVCCDLALEMLRHAPPGLAPQVRADASQLPFADGHFDVVVMVNMLLFPAEIDRILDKNRGKIMWVNTLGDQTPIHLPPGDVAAALPGAWHGTTARAGSGFWAVLERRQTE